MKENGRGRNSSVHAQRVAVARSPLRVGRDGSSSLMNNPMMGGKASSVSPHRRMIGPGSILYQELFEEPTPSAAAPFAPFSSAVVGPGSSVSSFTAKKTSRSTQTQSKYDACTRTRSW